MLRSIQCSCSSTQNVYAFQSTVPGSRCGADKTRRRHEPVSRPASISAGPTFLRPISSSSDNKADSTGSPSGVASKSTTLTSSLRNGRTVPNRFTSMARHASSASESSGGVSSNSAVIAAAGLLSQEFCSDVWACWVARTGRPKAELTLWDEERASLEGWVRRRSTPQAWALRCRIILACATGASNKDVAARLGSTA
ncbi:hypothetical protein ACH4D7_37750, partial [Streptomyces sp. NPDC018063]